MRSKINNEVLCVLKYQENEIILDYEPIEQNFSKELETVNKLCKVNYDNLANIISFLEDDVNIKLLQKHYRYCKYLDGSYEGFKIDINEKVKIISQTRDLIYLNHLKNKDCTKDEDISKLQDKILNDVTMWILAFDIEKTYRKCFENPVILTFSHRINGWSNPEYKLTQNFTLELKTNFGYGGSSYFYVLLKYKNIEITPFSEWIDYEFSKFSEIIRYSKSFAGRFLKGIYNNKKVFKGKIDNCDWEDAMKYTLTACNCSLKDENDFVKNYIIEECEKMVFGLEHLYLNNEFSFKGESDSHYKVDKHGHLLMEFRGEKISGSLDFISKILEFEKITEMKSFIIRIEDCNKKIQPLLVEELKIIVSKLDKLRTEISNLKPTYLDILDKNQYYLKQKSEIKSDLINSKILDPKNLDFTKLEDYFLAKFPEIKIFREEFTIIVGQYSLLIQQNKNLSELFENITIYNSKILKYFGK